MKVVHKQKMRVVHKRKTNYRSIFISIIVLFLLGLLFSCGPKEEHTKFDGQVFTSELTGDQIILKHHYMSTYKIIELKRPQ